MTVVVHRPGCCQRGCPAVARGRDPAACALRLTGACVGCGCGATWGAPGPVRALTGPGWTVTALVWDGDRRNFRPVVDVVPDLGEWDAITRTGDQEPPAITR